MLTSFILFFVPFTIGVAIGYTLQVRNKTKESTPSASHNRRSMPNYSCVCGYWMSTIEYRKGKCPSCNKVIA